MSQTPGGNGFKGSSRGWKGGKSRGFNMYYRGYKRHNKSFAKAQGSRLTNELITHPVKSINYVQKSIHPCPFKKWPQYLPDEDYVPGSPLASKVDKLLTYFKENLLQFSKTEVEERQEVVIEFQGLISDPALKQALPELENELRGNPLQTLSCIALCIHQAFLDDQFSENAQSIPVFFDVPCINVRLVNFEPLTPLKSLKANYYGKLVAVHGTVVRVSNVKPLATKVAFACNSCTAEQVVSLPDGKYTVPTKCCNSECRGRVFLPLRSSPLTETIDWQNIKIQEIISDDRREAGRIPRTVECELTNGLVDSCVPGDLVTVTGIVKVVNSDDNAGRARDKSMYLLYIHAVSLTNSKESVVKSEGDQDFSKEFNIKELYAIQEIQGEENVFRLIVGSLCPAIYGHELVKAGLILALFGGSQKYADDKNRIPIRGDPHVLVVGDPGLGKSQMLQAVSAVAPRGVYVCGNTTTTSGLTVTLSKEAGSGDYALEAGALVLGDQGCCCIDEFDKMSSQHQALLEAMEQQSISIAKAGVVCSLPARTSIVAAANPVGGHYNKAKTVSENLRMSSALLSRFDLVFILLDKPDEEMDGILSEHVMRLHSNKSAMCRSAHSVTVERGSNDLDADCDRAQWEKDKPLTERLKVKKGDDIDPIPGQLLRKYVQYARKYVHPRLSSDAASILQDFYLTLRKRHQGPNCTPITTRQLESLIRLTEARARLELRERATAQDAKDVVEIMKNSLIDTYSDEFGDLDFTRSHNGSGMSKRAQSKKFVSELSRIADRDHNSLYTVDQMYRIAMQLKLQVDNFDDFIMSLNNQNFLLKKGPRLYQLQTASCL